MADGWVQQREHLGDLNLEQLAEDGADVDAGKKIARAARSSGGAGVVAELVVVEREIHERGDRHRAALTNQIRNPHSAIRNDVIPFAPARTLRCPRATRGAARGARPEPSAVRAAR